MRGISSIQVTYFNFNPLIGTLKPQSNWQLYGDWYTGRWWVGCYISYSEDGPGRAAAPPSPSSLYQM